MKNGFKILDPEKLAPELRRESISPEVQLCAMGFILELLDKHADEFQGMCMLCPDKEGTILQYQDAVNIFYELIS